MSKPLPATFVPGFVVALACLLFAAGGLGAQERAAVVWVDCATARLPEDLKCGTVRVAEDPGRPEARWIDLFFVVVPASGPTPADDPVFFLAGGPGQAAAPMSPMLSRMWANVATTRDLVFVDQRGTGRSNPLQCPVAGDPDQAQSYLGGPFDPDRYRGCLEELSARADLAAYTTLRIIEDLERVRVSLGYERINLFGASYGSRLGLEYMRLRPQSIRSAVLEAVAPEFPRMLLTDAMRLDEAIATLASECAADADCSGAYPRFEEHLEEIVELLRAAPVTETLPARGRRPRQTLTIDADAFLTAVRYTLYSTPASRQLPRIVDRIADGDTAELARFVAGRTRGAGAGVALGMNRSVRCAEVVALTDPEQVRTAAASTLQGARRADDEFDICAFWPTGQVHAAHMEPVVSDVPTLLVTGEHDYATPAADGQRAARYLRNGLFLSLPGARHQLAGYDECLRGIYVEFFDRGAVDDLDTSCALEPPEWPFQVEPRAERDSR